MKYILKANGYNTDYYFKGFLLGFPEITPKIDEAAKFDFKEEASLAKIKLQSVSLTKYSIAKLNA